MNHRLFMSIFHESMNDHIAYNPAYECIIGYGYSYSVNYRHRLLKRGVSMRKRDVLRIVSAFGMVQGLYPRYTHGGKGAGGEMWAGYLPLSRKTKKE